MQVVFSDKQLAHETKYFRGRFVGSPEQPERARRLLAAVEQAGFPVSKPQDFAIDILSTVHSTNYIEFLRSAFDLWRKDPDAPEEVIASARPYGNAALYPRALAGRAGYHLSDAACPVMAHTFESARQSANSALTAAAMVKNGDAPFTYALCRPPGHHASTDHAGGFCYFNSTALAAQFLRSRHERVAILDVDVHHGNGTQEIFYKRPDILTVSLHADPADYYPFFWGYAEQIGDDGGEGFNLNLPLPLGADASAYLPTLGDALDRISAFDPGALVVALGLDAYAGDPLQGMRITTDDFSAIASRIASLGLPTVLVQEGGYLCPELGMNLASFLNGFEASFKT